MPEQYFPQSGFDGSNFRAMGKVRMERIRERIAAEQAVARERLSDRGIDPAPVIGMDFDGNPMTVAGFYAQLRTISVTEKSGQDPTFKMARLALASDLPARARDAAFVALNQQSAEEASHGDKIFGAVFFALGGIAPAPIPGEQNQQPPNYLLPTDDSSSDTQTLLDMMAVLGGVETLALENSFPAVLEACARWKHPLAEQLIDQVNHQVKPEEARHVLTWRYLFHTGALPKGEAAVERYFAMTNLGRDFFMAPTMERHQFDRHMKASCPSVEQLLGRPLPVSI